MRTSVRPGRPSESDSLSSLTGRGVRLKRPTVEPRVDLDGSSFGSLNPPPGRSMFLSSSSRSESMASPNVSAGRGAPPTSMSALLNLANVSPQPLEFSQRDSPHADRLRNLMGSASLQSNSGASLRRGPVSSSFAPWQGAIPLRSERNGMAPFPEAQNDHSNEATIAQIESLGTELRSLIRGKMAMDDRFAKLLQMFSAIEQRRNTSKDHGAESSFTGGTRLAPPKPAQGSDVGADGFPRDALFRNGAYDEPATLAAMNEALPIPASRFSAGPGRGHGVL